MLADPEMVKKFGVIGLEPVGSTGEETRAAIARDLPKWAKVIEEASKTKLSITLGPLLKTATTLSASAEVGD